MKLGTTEYRLEFGLGRAKKKKHYGFFHLFFDFVLTMLTGGLWLIWILIRYLRRNS